MTGNRSTLPACSMSWLRTSSSTTGDLGVHQWRRSSYTSLFLEQPRIYWLLLFNLYLTWKVRKKTFSFSMAAFSIRPTDKLTGTYIHRHTHKHRVSKLRALNNTWGVLYGEWCMSGVLLVNHFLLKTPSDSHQRSLIQVWGGRHEQSIELFGSTVPRWSLIVGATVKCVPGSSPPPPPPPPPPSPPLSFFSTPTEPNKTIKKTKIICWNYTSNF